MTMGVARLKDYSFVSNLFKSSLQMVQRLQHMEVILDTPGEEHFLSLAEAQDLQSDLTRILSPFSFSQAPSTTSGGYSDSFSLRQISTSTVLQTIYVFLKAERHTAGELRP